MTYRAASHTADLAALDAVSQLLADEHSQTAEHFQLAPDETPPLGNSQIAYLRRFGRKPPSKGSR